MQNISIYPMTTSEDGIAVREYLKRVLGMSRQGIARLKREQGIFLNGAPVYVNVPVRAGDMLELRIFDSPSKNIRPEPMALSVAYEDDELLVLDKPPGIPVHQSRGHIYGTLSNGVAWYFAERGWMAKVRPMNRLDQDTSGLVFFAKNAQIQSLFARYPKYEITKEYLAIISGYLPERTGQISLPIGLAEDRSGRRIIRQDGDSACTEFTELLRFRGASLVKLRLWTGRTHQLRVHLAQLGHPILGDTMYGGDTTWIGRQALHAFRASFLHPVQQRLVTVKAALPEDMLALVRRLV